VTKTFEHLNDVFTYTNSSKFFLVADARLLHLS
jgi:hypothetical protein